MRIEAYNRIMTGKRSKLTGAMLEELINKACNYYSDIGTAEISKTPEPMRVIKNLGYGKFMTIFEKKAQPDYKGTLKGGKSIVFEAKHTDSDRIKRSVISSEQELRLNKHMRLLANCYVLLSYSLNNFYMMPWAVFRDMKGIYGRQYVLEKDVTAYKVQINGGILRFLECESIQELRKVQKRSEAVRSGQKRQGEAMI